jgi:hypothetical protein
MCNGDFMLMGQRDGQHACIRNTIQHMQRITPFLCRARKELRSIFSKIVQARRASGVKEEDVLQQFVDARCVYKNCIPTVPAFRNQCERLLNPSDYVHIFRYVSM